MLPGGHAAQPVGFLIGLLRGFVEQLVPRLLVPAIPHDAEMDVAIPCVAEADHPHAGLGFQRMDEADKFSGLADGHHDVHRLLLGDGLRRLDQSPAHPPDLSGLGCIVQGDDFQGTLGQHQLVHAVQTFLHFQCPPVKGQQ